MTDPPDLQSLFAVIFSHHCLELRLHLVPCFLCLPGLMTPYFSFFALSRQSCLIAPCLAFKHFCFPDFELDVGVISLLTDLHHLDSYFASTPPFFLPCLLCSQPRYSSRTLAVTLRRVYLLVALLTISFLVAFATEPLPCPGFSLIFGVRCAIFGTLYTDA